MNPGSPNEPPFTAPPITDGSAGDPTNHSTDHSTDQAPIPPRLRRLLTSLFFLVVAATALSPALASGGLFTSRYDWRYFEAMA